MNSITLSLLAQFGSAIILFTDVVEKYIEVSYDTAMKQVKAGDIELNIFRLGNRQSSPYLVHFDDLSPLLEKKRKNAMESLKECAQELASARRKR